MQRDIGLLHVEVMCLQLPTNLFQRNCGDCCEDKIILRNHNVIIKSIKILKYSIFIKVL